MVLALPTDVLFDSGKTKVKPRGKEALGQVADVLTTAAARLTSSSVSSSPTPSAAASRRTSSTDGGFLPGGTPA